MNRIVIHTYQFLKMYCLKKFEETDKIPNIDKQFIVLIMKTLCKQNSSGRSYSNESQIIVNELEKFYKVHYRHLMKEKEQFTYTNLSQMIEYEAESIITCLSNHIQERFDQMLNRYVNIYVDKKSLEETFDKNKVRYRLKNITNMILNNISITNETDVKIETHFKENIIKLTEINKSMAYMAAASDGDRLKLLELLIRMSINGEKIVKQRQLPEDKGRLFAVINCFPLRKNIKPKYVDIDTFLIVQNLISGNKSFYQTNGNLLTYSDEIWGKFFRVERKHFKKKGYVFNRRISTDGIGCTILFVREDLYNPFKKSYVRQIKKPKNYNPEKYVKDLSEEEKRSVLGMTKIGIDPGKNDLIYCTNGKIKEVTKNNGKIYRKTETFRYSHSQRKFEMKDKKYSELIEDDKKSTIVSKKTIKEYESKLSNKNASSCIWKNVIGYIKLKNEINDKISSYYEKQIHRTIKWYTYINKKRSEENMINRFENKFGSPKDTAILIGDFSEKYQMKHHEPTKGKSIRKLFKNKGYKLYLVDEFNTSRRYYKNGAELANFVKRTATKEQKEKDKHITGYVHTILGSKLYIF